MKAKAVLGDLYSSGDCRFGGSVAIAGNSQRGFSALTVHCCTNIGLLWSILYFIVYIIVLCVECVMVDDSVIVKVECAKLCTL